MDYAGPHAPRTRVGSVSTLTNRPKQLEQLYPVESDELLRASPKGAS